jgi:hypothetical protein
VALFLAVARWRSIRRMKLPHFSIFGLAMPLDRDLFCNRRKNPDWF